MRLALFALLVTSACVLDSESYPSLSGFRCTPDPLARSQAPYSLDCEVTIDDDAISELDIHAVDATRADVPVHGPTFSGLQQGHITFQLTLMAEPAPGELSLRMTGFGISDGNDSAPVTTSIVVQ